MERDQEPGKAEPSGMPRQPTWVAPWGEGPTHSFQLGRMPHPITLWVHRACPGSTDRGVMVSRVMDAGRRKGRKLGAKGWRLQVLFIKQSGRLSPGPWPGTLHTKRQGAHTAWAGLTALCWDPASDPANAPVFFLGGGVSGPQGAPAVCISDSTGEVRVPPLQQEVGCVQPCCLHWFPGGPAVFGPGQCMAPGQSLHCPKGRLEAQRGGRGVGVVLHLPGLGGTGPLGCWLFKGRENL